MEKIKIVKGVVSFIVGLGTTKIVSSIIKNNTDPEKVTDKVAIGAGSLVLGGMVAEKSKVYTDAKIDELFAAFTTVKDEVQDS